MRILDHDAVGRAVAPETLLAAVRRALLLQEDGDYVMPDRLHLERDGNTLLAMPAWAGDAFATKLVSVFPGNPGRGLPAVGGAVVLNDGATGAPLALLDAASLTALRTGAVGGVCVDLTAPDDVTTLGLVGCGVQGFQQVVFACAVRGFRRVNLLDPHAPDLPGFVDRLSERLPGVEFVVRKAPGDLVAASEVIVTATTSHDPVLPDDPDLLGGRTYVGLGSFRPDMREFPRALYGLVDRVLLDVDLARQESGDVRTPLDEGWINEDRICRLGQVLDGGVPIDRAATTLCKSVGMALFDLLAAEAVHRAALETGAGIDVDFP